MIAYTIVAGFLGSGKTSLINGLLQTTTERLAIVVNDIGELSLDAFLLGEAVSDGTDDVIELANGCVCCSIGDSLAVTLRELCLRPNPPDRIVLECSGAADPSAVARYGNRNVLAEPQIVTVVDATDIRRRASDRLVGGLVEAQLRAASLLSVSKLDLVDDATTAQVLGWLRETQPGKAIVAGHPRELGTIDSATLGETGGSAPAFVTRTVEFASSTTPNEVEALLALPQLVRAKGLVEMPDGWRLIQWAAGAGEQTTWAGAPPAKGFVTTIATTDR